MRTTWIAVILLIGIQPVSARMTKHIGSKERLKAADLVIKGQVLNVVDSGPASSGWGEQIDQWIAKEKVEKPHVAVADIKVEAEIKGKSAGPIVQVKFLQHSASGFSGVRKDDFVIAFLKKQGDSYRPIDFDNWNTAASRKSLKSRASKDEDALFDEIRSKTDEADPRRVKEALEELDELEPERAGAELAKFRKSKNVGIRARALRQLISKGDATAGDELKEVAKEKLAGRSNAYTLEQQEIRNDVSKALWDVHRRKDSKFASTAVDLLDHPDEIIRTAARYALRGMRDPATRPQLVRLLDEPSLDSQYIGVITLCEIEKKPNCPSKPLFKQSPEKYVKEWKDWAAKSK